MRRGPAGCWIVAIIASSGCVDHVRTCGGVEIVITLDDPSWLPFADDELEIALVLDGERLTRRFDAAALATGRTSVIVELAPDADTELGVEVDIADRDGVPGLLHGEAGLTVPAGGAGCVTAEVPVTALEDGDGDRVPDARDVCPADVDPDQEDADSDAIGDACDVCPEVDQDDDHDEDSDGLPDDCDPCPIAVDPDIADPADEDDDGVGDACDPRPAIGGDHIVAFLPFADPAELALLVAVGPTTASIADDRLTLQGGGTGGPPGGLVLDLPGLGTEVQVVTKAHQIGKDGGLASHGVAAWVDPAATSNLDGVTCLARPAPPTGGIGDVVLDDWPGGNLSSSFIEPQSLSSINTVRMTATRPLAPDAQVSCVANSDAVLYEGPIDAVETGFGVASSYSTDEFEYLLVIDIPES